MSYGLAIPFYSLHSALFPAPYAFLDPVFPEEPCKHIRGTEYRNHCHESGNRKNCHSRKSGATCATSGKLGTINEKDATKECKDQPPRISNFRRFFNFKPESFRQCSR